MLKPMEMVESNNISISICLMNGSDKAWNWPVICSVCTDRLQAKMADNNMLTFHAQPTWENSLNKTGREVGVQFLKQSQF